MTAEDIKAELDRLYPDKQVITMAQAGAFMDWDKNKTSEVFHADLRGRWTQNHPIKVFKSDFAEATATERNGRRNGN